MTPDEIAETIGWPAGTIEEMVANDNAAPNNSGVMIYVDILAPVVSAGRLRTEARGAPETSEAGFQVAASG